MISQELAKIGLPDTPGVYYFLDQKGEILYVGKATSLKDRVKSYFAKDLVRTRGERMVEMVTKAVTVKFRPTDSVLEALLLEAQEIHKQQPFYNSLGKDDKSFNYVTITDEDFPIISITRGTGTYGPFPHGGELRAALKIVRRIFPYRDEKCPMKVAGKPCFNAQIGLCPGVCAGWMSKTEYRKQVRRIKMFFEGRKMELVEDLEKAMKAAAKKQEFEEAEKYKRMLYALEHIQDIALIKRDLEGSGQKNGFRIEAYDIAHLSGKEAVGVMTVVCDGELDKSQYRKFKIKLDKNDDVGNLREVLTRRRNHPEWPKADLVVVDGGQAQLNVAAEIMNDVGVASVVKNDQHKAKEILHQGDSSVHAWEKSILLANAEAHRFAIGYHRKLRSKGFRI